MNLVNKSIRRISTYIVDIINLFKPNKLFINGYFLHEGCRISLNNNWGDDINITFLQDISNLNILVKSESPLYKYFPIKAFNCIGSVIGYYTDKYTSIWGSGIISENMSIPYKPIRVYSVRGPLTREILLKNGIDCPEIYGDPALLISRYYRPDIEKKYELGIIPHFIDENNNAIKDFCESHPDVLIIHMRGYKHWQDIPNQILSCKKIISSSLHGLIVSDSYGIPNKWVRFSNDIVGGNFKYHDYFASVGRICGDPTPINTSIDIKNIIDNNLFELASNIDYDIIFEACPFKEYLQDYRKMDFSLLQYKKSNI